MSPEQTDSLTSHAWYSRLLEAAETLVRDTAGHVIFWNTAAEVTYGFTRDEAIGCLVHDLLATRFPQPLADIEEILWRTGQWNGELVHRNKSGDEVIVESRWILSTEAGKPSVVIEVNTNVTERKRAREALRLNQERFRLALQHSPVAVFSQDLELRYTWVQNPGAPLTVENLLGKTDLELAESPDEGQRLSALKREVIRTGVGFQGEVSFTLGGNTRFYELTVEPLRSEAGAIEGITCVSHDITRRRLRELELEQREERLRLAQDAANIGSWSWEIKTNLTTFSDRYFQQLGIAPVNHSFHEWLALIHPDDRDHVEACIAGAMRQGSAYDIEYRVVHPDGKLRWLLSKGRMFRDEAGNPLRLTGINLDITDQKIAAQERERLARELHAERLRLQAVIEQMPSGLALIVPPEGRMLLYNSEAERLWRHPAHKVEYRRDHAEYGAYHPDGQRFRAEEYPIVRALVEGQTIRQQEIRYRRGDNTWTWFTVNAAPIRDENGITVAAVAVFHDIGDIRRIQEELQSSHARLRQALGAADMGSWEVDFLNQVVISADSTAILFGLPPGTHSITAYAQQIHPDDRSRVMDLLYTSLENRKAYSADFRVETPSGQRWLLSRGEVLATADRGDLMIGAVIDITSRRQSEQALHDSEERAKRHLQELEAIYRNAPVGLCVLDRDLRWVRVNERIAEMNGFPVAHHMGHTLRDLLPDLAPLAEPVLRRVLETGEPVLNHELVGETPAAPGVKRTWIENWHPIFDDEKNVVGVNVTTEEITERKRMEDELRRSNADLTQFAYAVSHDLQEPVRMMTAFSQLLIRESGQANNPHLKDIIAYIERGGARMQALLQDLLTYCRLQQTETAIVPVSCGDIVTEVVETLQPILNRTGATITVDSLPTINVHRVHLSQMFQNLIGNALKYVRPAVPPVIHISAEPSNAGGWTFTVADNGIGIHPDHRDYIFGLFKRLHGGQRYEGTGIGLALCKRIAESYGGQIWVDSEPGQGSTFRFTLPLA